MADRTDMDTLVDSLARLCREHKAMQIVLSELDGNWQRDVLHGANAPAIRDAVDTLFGEARGSLESGQRALHIVSLLAQTVDRSLLVSGSL